MILPVATAAILSHPNGAGAALRARRAPLGMTLVEMLVAMTLTLLLMGAVAQIFGMLGQGVNGSRSMAELNDRLRAAGYRLRQDLAGITVDPTPPVRPELNSGYLEIIEGPESDRFTYLSGTQFDKSKGSVIGGKWVGDPEPYASVVGSDDRLVGDVDDVLLFTTRSSGDMFSGRADTTSSNIEGSSVRSPYAEVIWFCRPTANTGDPRTYTLYRRQRIVTAHPGTPPFVDMNSGPPFRNTSGGNPNTIPFTTWAEVYSLTDVSIRRQGDSALPNSLGDLTRRESRYLHNGAVLDEFPHPMYAFDPVNHTFDKNVRRFGEDVILTNVIAFDVRVWDPTMEVKAVPAHSSGNAGAYAVQPGDPGYAAGGVPAGTTAVQGGYVDLGVNINNPLTQPPSTFAGKGYPIPSKLVAAKQFTYPTYDTWSTFYETNGVDDDGDVPTNIDEGTNGKDDDGNGAIDEPEERETAPPYPTPLRGIQVRLRVYEPSSRQIRQMTILKSF